MTNDGMSRTDRIARLERRMSKEIAGAPIIEIAPAISTLMANFMGQIGGTLLDQCQGIDAIAGDAKALLAKRAGGKRQ
jgi:hypothetical protein